MADKKLSCVRPTSSVEKAPSKEVEEKKGLTEKEESGMSIMVGRKAPDFTAPAYHKGEFTQVKLSDHIGKWVVLCFYPGDFTFV